MSNLRLTVNIREYRWNIATIFLVVYFAISSINACFSPFNMIVARPSMSIMESSDLIFFVGGDFDSQPIVDIYDAKQNTWLDSMKFSESYIRFEGTVVDSTALFIGSFRNNSVDLFAYDIDNKSLRSIPVTNNSLVGDSWQNKWRSITVDKKAYFYDDYNVLIIDIYTNNVTKIRSQAGQNAKATTNGTHLIFASWSLFFLDLETLQWTRPDSSGSHNSVIAIFYVNDERRTLLFVEGKEIRITSLDSLNSYSSIQLKEYASSANIIGDAMYITSETGISVVYYKLASQQISYNSPLIQVFYQLGSTNIKSYGSIVYNGSIYYTSTSPNVYRMDLQWLFRPMDLNVSKVTDTSASFAADGYYVYFNTNQSSIHYYNLSTGELQIIGQRNFPATFSRADTTVLGNKQLLVLRYPEYDIFNINSNTWNTSTLPFEFSAQGRIASDNYAVFQSTFDQRDKAWLYLFDLHNRDWLKLETKNYSSTFIVHDKVAVVGTDGTLQVFDILTRQWYSADFTPLPNMVSSIQYEESVVIAYSGSLRSTLIIFDLATNTTVTTEVIGPIGNVVETYGDFIVFAITAEKLNLETVRLKILNVKKLSWNTLDLPPNYQNEPMALGVNNNVAYLARNERVESIDLSLFTTSTVTTPTANPQLIYFVGNKVMFLSSSGAARIITLYDPSTKTSTSLRFSTSYLPYQDLRITENYIVAKIDGQMHYLQYSALFTEMSDSKIFIGQSTNFTAHPSGQSFPQAHWEDKYGNFLGTGFNLTLSNVSLKDAGGYTIKIFDQCQQQMQQSTQLFVYGSPIFAADLSDVIVLCNDSTIVSTRAIGEQVQLAWTVDGERIDQELSQTTLNVSDLACESSHKLCVIATNPSGSTKQCSILQVLAEKSVFDGPAPLVDHMLWFSESQVQLRVELLNPECTHHTWLMNGVDMGFYGAQQSEITVHMSTAIEGVEYQVEALCINNKVRSHAFKFTNVTSLTPLGLSLIIISVALIIAVPILVSVIYRKRLRHSKQTQQDLEMMLSHAKAESIRARDNVTILQPTTWEWIPTDDYSYKSIENLPFNVDFSALNYSSKNAVDVDVFVQGDITFSSKAKSQGVKMPLLGSSQQVDIYVPKSPKYEITVEPSSFEVNRRSPIQVTVSSKLRMTAKCSICLIVVCEQDRTYSAIEFKVESKPSMWIDIEEVIMTEEFLGGGGFGAVTRGAYRGQDVAVKKLHMQSLPDEIITEFEREVSLMKSLHHPNIVQFIGASNVQNKLAIVIEFAPLGSLAGVMKKHRLPHALKVTMLIETAKALQFLHSNGIVHRDIKPHNILVFSLEPRAAVHVKLTDFGTARFIPENSTYVTRNTGTSGYMAPESLGKHPKISKSADVYSFAILMWEVMFDRAPFEDFNWQSEIEEHVLAGKRLPIPNDSRVPAELIQLIEECWHQDPTRRPTATAVAQRLAAM